jgi:DNA-directed RNA polymerase specialized sigma24 family protein
VSRVQATTGPPEVALESFEVTYGRLREPLRRLAFVLVSNAFVAEEIVQEAFVRYFRHRHRVQSPDAYLRSAVINACRNHHRWLAVRRRVLAWDAPAAPTPDHMADAIARLPHRQRAVVVLRFYESMSEREISDVLRIPIGTVKSTLHRALGHLRRSLGDD